jgi:enoyl reductase-like protein
VFKLPREKGGAWLQEHRAEVEERWLDLSLRNLAGDRLRGVEERFAGMNGSGPKASKLQSYSSLDKPPTFVTSFFEKYPLVTEQLLAREDKSCFLNIAQRSGQSLHLSSQFWITTLKSGSRRYLGTACVWCSGAVNYSFIIGFSLGVGGYRSCLRPGPPARGDPSEPRCSA